MEDEVMEGKGGGKSRMILKEKRNLKGKEGWKVDLFLCFHPFSFWVLHSSSLLLLSSSSQSFLLPPPLPSPHLFIYHYHFLFHLSSCLLPLWPSCFFFPFIFIFLVLLLLNLFYIFPVFPLLFYFTFILISFLISCIICVLLFFLHLAFVWPGTFNIVIQNL